MAADALNLPPKKRQASLWSLVVCGLIIELAFLSIHLAQNQRSQIAILLGVYLITGLAFIWLVYLLKAGKLAQPSRGVWVVMIAAAVVFRITLMPLAPASSPDVHRYLWEGIIQTHGFNPYESAPDSPELAGLARDWQSLHAQVSHGHVPTIYPAFGQLLFRCNALVFGGSLIGWKLILLLFDALLAIGVWAILKKRGIAPAGVVLVMWCPLLLLETYEGGHLDLIGVALLVSAIAALDRNRWLISAVAIALSVNIKYLWPALVLILLLGQAFRQRRGVAFLAVFAATTTACWLPYRAGLERAYLTAVMFAEKWTFNDTIFEQLRKLPGPPWVPMATVLFVLLMLAGLLVWRRQVDLWQDSWLLLATALLLGPVAFPWYFIWIVPALAWRPPTWLVVWPFCAAFLYLFVGWRHVISGQWDPMPWLWAIIVVIPIVGLFFAWRRRVMGISAWGTSTKAGFLTTQSAWLATGELVGADQG